MTSNTFVKYRHYKGGIYTLVCEARLESDPEVKMVVYQAADGTFWVRRQDVFFQEVELEGKTVPRFARID